MPAPKPPKLPPAAAHEQLSLGPLPGYGSKPSFGPMFTERPVQIRMPYGYRSPGGVADLPTWGAQGPRGAGRIEAMATHPDATHFTRSWEAQPSSYANQWHEPIDVPRAKKGAAMTIDDLIPSHVIKAVRDHGMHKVAGAMLDVPELTLKEATYVLGAKAYLRRKEARSIVDGIVAYAALTNEKVADNSALMAMLRRAAVPAAVGAGIAAAPRLLSSDPYEQQKSLVPSLGIGALLGGLTGVAGGLRGLPPELGQQVAQAAR